MITFEKCLLFGFDWAFFSDQNQDKKLLFLKFDAEGIRASFDIKADALLNFYPDQIFLHCWRSVNALTFPSFCKFLFAFFSHSRIGPIWRTCFQNTPKVSIKRHIFSFSFIQKQKHKVFWRKGSVYNLLSFLFFLCISLP